MTRIDLKLELPDVLARDAGVAGLLSADGLRRLIEDGMRREALRRITATVPNSL